MGPFSVDMTSGAGQEPDPVHEAAYGRIRRLIIAHKPYLDKMVKYPLEQIAGNFKIILIKKHGDMITLRGLWSRDPKFREYLKEKLAFHYGTSYTEKLIGMFLT